MKKIIIDLLTAILLLSLISCTPEEEEGVNIMDALKISAYVFDETVRGGEYNSDNAFYSFERLNLNEPKIVTVKTGDYNNMDLHFEFDGVIEVISEPGEIQLSTNGDLTRWHRTDDFDSRTFGYYKKFSMKGFLSAALSGASYLNCLNDGVTTPDTGGYEGKEYYLTVNAYNFENENDGAPFIKAQLKFVQLEDGLSAISGRSYYFSVELVSYEFSELLLLD